MKGDIDYIKHFEYSVRNLCTVGFRYTDNVCVKFVTKRNIQFQRIETTITYDVNGRTWYAGVFFDDRYKTVYHDTAKRCLKTFKNLLDKQ